MSPRRAFGALAHAALVLCGFLGTVIAVERAVAAKRRAAWLAALHASLLLRLGAGVFSFEWRAWGALANALALALFAVTAAGAALAWRHRHRHRVRGTRKLP